MNEEVPPFSVRPSRHVLHVPDEETYRGAHSIHVGTEEFLSAADVQDMFRFLYFWIALAFAVGLLLGWILL